MTGSFAASLKKLADEAAKTKRLAEEKAKRAEMLARAKASRLQRQEKDRARRLVLKEKLQAEKEHREKAAEEKRLHRQLAAAKQSKLKRIQAEKMKAAEAERIRREEEERLRLREIRLTQICSDIYGSLAVSAWDGVYSVVVADEAFDFKQDLIDMGLEVKRRHKLAKFASNALIEFIKTVEKFNSAANTKYDLDLSTELSSISTRLQKTGQFSLAPRFLKLAEQLQEISTSVLYEVQQKHFSLLAQISVQEAAIDQIKLNIRSAKLSLTEDLRRDKHRVNKIMAVVEKIKRCIDSIESSYKSRLPLGLAVQGVSLKTKADYLRLAYESFIPDINFNTFSESEIINLIRLANDRPWVDDLKNISQNDLSRMQSEYSYESAEPNLIERLNAKLENAKERLSNLNNSVKNAKAKTKVTTAMLKKAGEFHQSCLLFQEVLAKKLEGVTASLLRFVGGHYIGPTMAELSVERPAKNAYLDLAYKELRWLSSEDGQDFAGYLDIVLSELAKEGARRAEVTFIENDEENRVEVGKVSLVCKIGPALMSLLFTKRGITAVDTSASDGRTIFMLRW